ncbi:hypothetical protein [Corynebacterium sp. AOP12-C2-36]|uniref:hypothetical protein n=1 Tax=Corynebacterium sp. AOP12-C2-36 TaxID=3457723 RepID=UPI004034B529
MPDFQAVYHLRLTDVLEQWNPQEALLLIVGLQERGDTLLAGRLAGDESGMGWSIRDWLALDSRNELEALRVMQVNKGRKRGSKKSEFRTWDHYPGREAERRRETTSKLDRLRSLAAKGGGEVAG